MKIHKTIHVYIGPIWFHLVGVTLEGNKWKERKWYFWVFIWRRKCEGKLVGHKYFLHMPTKIQSPQIREKMGEKRGKKKSHVFWTKILTSKTFLFFPLLSISFFIFCLFLLLLIHFSALSFVCSSFFSSHMFFFVHPFVFLICFALLCVCLYVYFNEVPSIHNWIEQIYTIYMFYPSSHFSLQLNNWVLAPNQMKP